MKDVVIVGAARTAIGRFNGTLRDFSAPKLGAISIQEAMKRAGIQGDSVDEVIMGNVISAGLGQNPARQALIHAGLPPDIGAVTVNKVCGSGLKSVMMAASAVKAEDADLIVAGGMENMNLGPYLLDKARYGYRLGEGRLIDAMVFDGLWDIYNDFHMGITGEIIAEKFNVTREDADKLALRSHELAAKAISEGKFTEEIVPVSVPQRKKDPIEFDTDEGVRADSTLEKLANLKPAFKKDGLVTAGNASQISDGGAAVIVTSREKAEELGCKPMAKIIDYNTGGLAPELVMEAPIPTVRALMEKTGFGVDDIDLFEHNEAFASASVAVKKELAIPDEKFNVHGGAVALGHPIGCSGTRVLITLLYALKQRGLKRGLATLCLGGGNAVAMIVEMEKRRL
ncbi:MAG: acetyl-CoA C-acetyltransferase [Thermoplasmata archaeon]|nr:MAG: acetyl-CoA C-acetyltransferase [Thermoplasmata archaeon]